MRDDRAQNERKHWDEGRNNLPRLFARFFWGTIIVLAVASIGLLSIGLLRSFKSPSDPHDKLQAIEQAARQEIEIEQNTLQKLFERAARIAATETSNEIGELLDELYSPVYGSISSYADFHYTILGEYTELAGAALGIAADAIENKLYNGFPERLESVANTLDARFVDEFRTALMQELKAEIPAELSGAPLAPITQRAIENAHARMKVTAPVGAVMATVGGAASIKAVSAVIARKVATKVATKAAAKGIVKGSGILSGAGLGALGGSWAGPVGAAVGGLVGGAASWFAVDAAAITIDEYFTRDDFEADLRLMVDEHRSVVRNRLIAAVERKSEDMKNFTLQDLSNE